MSEIRWRAKYDFRMKGVSGLYTEVSSHTCYWKRVWMECETEWRLETRKGSRGDGWMERRDRSGGWKWMTKSGGEWRIK